MHISINFYCTYFSWRFCRHTSMRCVSSHCQNVSSRSFLMHEINSMRIIHFSFKCNFSFAPPKFARLRLEKFSHKKRNNKTQTKCTHRLTASSPLGVIPKLLFVPSVRRMSVSQSKAAHRAPKKRRRKRQAATR